ncbi:galactose mutarotase [Zeaxanthinibacter sp. PT1]|uniref:aldose epimerase family protein n=1 Tax=Zeaxanthinibacter TaxID=561554 RepID=UPI00234BD926|nr:aldose epimerase family protein [Zeaxanthinibacter sp. PT1]MDC6352563.1 galactose mutarotase [Zeaxanthinibacter sp. PT1]
MEQITIKNHFLQLQVLTYGAIIQRLSLLSGDHESIDLVVGLNDPEDYKNDENSLGACIGRFAGRISGGGFMLDGTFYRLAEENGVHLHGGNKGFAKREWTILEVSEGPEPSVSLGYSSEHMEEGYPGKLNCRVTYTLKNNGLEIVHRATTDRPTIVNLTNHSYFRLDKEDTIEHYRLQLNCHEYLETGADLIPTGAIKTVKGTEFDFLQAKPIGQVKLDTPFVLGKSSGTIAELHSDSSGIRMTVQTNQPALIVYRPENLTAICFETQLHPDAPNHAYFPSSVLRPGETYENRTLFSFDRVKN